MSRAIWRAALGTLRANRRLSYYYVFAAFFTAQACGLLFARRTAGAILLLAFWTAFAWPLYLSAPTYRQLLRLPLSARDAGTVAFILRVLGPCVSVLVSVPLLAPLFARVQVPAREFLTIAFGLCAAFPLMCLAPFLPLPASWRISTGGSPEGNGNPRLRWIAVVALWVLSPAIAVMPLVALRLRIAGWPWLSLLLGLGLALLVWRQRERLTHAALSAGPDDSRQPRREGGTHRRGWSGFVPVMLPVIARSGLLGCAAGIFLTVPFVASASAAMVPLLIAMSVALSAIHILNCTRALQLLPVSRARLDALMLALLLLPTLAGCLLAATVGQLLDSQRVSTWHVELLCLLSLTCHVVLFVPAVRSTRRPPIAPMLAASAALQAGLALAVEHFGIALPPDGWAFGACIGLLVVSLAWLAAGARLTSIRPIAGLAALIWCLPVHGAQAPDPAQFAASAQALLDRYVQDGRFSGAVLVARDGKPMLREGFGLALREWDVGVTPDTEFRIGSLTKQFTATAILQLAERGKLALADPIGKYYAAAPKSWDSVTLAQLLSHRSGIPSFTDLPGFADTVARQDLSPEQIIELTRDAPLHFAPGTQFEYSNSGYILLGYVIARQSATPYAEYLRQQIFQPLGMNHTGYDDSAQLLPHRASGYRREQGRWLNASFASMSVPYAAGALYSNIDDLLIWDQALAAAKLLARASLAAMLTDHGEHYGYGYVIDEDLGHRREWHNGGINGFASYLGRYPDDGLTVIVLANLEGAPVDEIGAQLAHIAFGEPAQTVRGSAAHTGTEAALRRIIGELSAGRVDFDRIGPELAARLKPQIGATQALLARCGALESVAFTGSTEHGWDLYVAQFQNAALEWRIVLGADGRIAGLRLSPH